MNRPPASSVVVSVVLAALMWFVVTWFAQPLPPPGDARPAAASAQSPPAPVEKTATCDEVEDQMRGVVEQARGCSIDEDCTIFDYGYPIECLMSVARASVPVLRREFERYHASCEYRVYYDCPTGDMQRVAVCRNNRCQVDIVTIDSLKDQTLDLLRQ